MVTMMKMIMMASMVMVIVGVMHYGTGLVLFRTDPINIAEAHT